MLKKYNKKILKKYLNKIPVHLHGLKASGYQIKGLIKRDIVPQVLRHPLSPSTYKSYFCYAVIFLRLLLGGKLTTLSTKSKFNLVYHANLCTIFFKILFFGELFSSFLPIQDYFVIKWHLSNSYLGPYGLYFVLLVKLFVKVEGVKINIL